MLCHPFLFYLSCHLIVISDENAILVNTKDMQIFQTFCCRKLEINQDCLYVCQVVEMVACFSLPSSWCLSIYKNNIWNVDFQGWQFLHQSNIDASIYIHLELY